MPLDRRAFLATLGAGLGAPAILGARPRVKRYPICFSTLGCPAWGWETILEQADRLGYPAVELRGVAGEMDLTKVPPLSGRRLAGSRRQLADRGLVVPVLGASAFMHAREPAERARQLDEGRRYVDLAHALGATYVRIFPNLVPKGDARPDVVARIVDGSRELAGYAKPAGVGVLLESHGDFTGSRDLAAILEGVASEAFALLWDAHNSFVATSESPAAMHAALGRWIRHVHLKDSRPEGTAYRYVLTGEGAAPVRELVRVLAAGGYRGFYSFEWEKAWHPEIEEPEVAFPHYAKVMGAWLEEAGIRPA